MSTIESPVAVEGNGASSKRRSPRKPQSGYRRQCLLLAGALAVCCLGSLLLAATAHAFNPLKPVEDLEAINPIGGAAVKAAASATGDVASSAALSAFKSILNWLFGGIEAKIGTAVLKFLTIMRIYTGGAMASLYQVTFSIAAATLTVVMTLSVVRYWLAGFSNGDSFGALRGALRTIGAGCAIAIWPWLFKLFAGRAGLVNAVDEAILGSAALHASLVNLFQVALVANVATASTGGGMFLLIIEIVLSSVMLLALLFLKVVLTYMLGVIYIAMPLVLIVWPIEELAWLARTVLRTFVILLIIPLAWTIVFATFGAISMNAISFAGLSSLGWWQALLEPLVAIAMLWAAIYLPLSLLRIAKNTAVPGGGGRSMSIFAGLMASRIIGGEAHTFMQSKGWLPSSQYEQPSKGKGDTQAGGGDTPNSGGSDPKPPKWSPSGGGASSNTTGSGDRREGSGAGVPSSVDTAAAAPTATHADADSAPTEPIDARAVTAASEPAVTDLAEGESHAGLNGAEQGAALTTSVGDGLAGTTAVTGEGDPVRATDVLPAELGSVSNSGNARRSDDNPELAQTIPSHTATPLAGREAEYAAYGRQVARGVTPSQQAVDGAVQRLGPDTKAALSSAAQEFPAGGGEFGDHLVRWSTTAEASAMSTGQHEAVMTLASASYADPGLLRSHGLAPSKDAPDNPAPRPAEPLNDPVWRDVARQSTAADRARLADPVAGVREHSYRALGGAPQPNLKPPANQPARDS